MAVTVTPGGASDDSMLSLADLETHCTDFGHDISSYTDPQKEQSLRRMTLMVAGLGTRSATRTLAWPGARATATQAQPWPRTGAYRADGTAIDDETIPREIEMAIAEAVFYDLENPGVLQAAITSPTQSAVTKKKVGDIEIEYAQPRDGVAWEMNRPILPIIYDILSGLLIPERKGKSTHFATVGRGTINWD